jgi:hypothetical protein
MSKRYSKLKRVELNDRRLSEAGLMALVRSNPSLVSFRTSAHEATEAFVRELARCCTGLTELSLTGVDVAHASLCYLMKQCPEMASLALADGSYLPSMMEIELPVLTNMRKIVFGQLFESSVNTRQLYGVLHACPNLTSLEVWECPVLSENTILPIGTRFPSLQRIRLFECGSAVENKLLIDISKHYPLLRELTIPSSDRVTDAGIIAMARKCPLLEKLDVSRCFKLTDASLFALAQCCPSLKDLAAFRCAKFTDVGITAVMQACPGLLALCVDGCIGLSNALLRKIKKQYQAY